jgi:hypothetical protein
VLACMKTCLFHCLMLNLKIPVMTLNQCNSTDSLDTNFLTTNTVVYLLKARNVKPAEATVASEHLCKHARYYTTASITHNNGVTGSGVLCAVRADRYIMQQEKNRWEMFSMRSVSSLNKEWIVHFELVAIWAYCEIPHEEGRIKGTKCYS